MHPLPTATLGSPSLAARWVALLVVALDLTAPLTWRYFQFQVGGADLALIGILAVACFERGSTLGMVPSPRQGWGYWFRIGFSFALLIALLLTAFTSVWVLLEKPLPVYRSNPEHLVSSLLFMCVTTPAYEETVYRALLCFAIAPWRGERTAIMASGVCFALLHVFRGNASPENLIAGFLLAWAFLKSGTILVPIAMHAAGNLVALASQTGAWYLFPEAQSRVFF